MEKIDVFCHVVLPGFRADIERATGEPLHGSDAVLMNDMEKRIQEMDTHEGLRQILTVSGIDGLDHISAADGMKLSCRVNDEMAELGSRYPKHFVGGIATVSLKDPKAAAAEMDRAVNQLRLRGLQINTTFMQESISDQKFWPVYEKMAELDLPILVHPCHGPMCPPEMVFNWPMETSWMMIRMSTSGVFERFPNIKFLTHHCGAFVPLFHERLYLAWYHNHMYPKKEGERSPEEYFENLRKFYNDTALYGDCTKALEMGVEFFGADHVLFGTDYPLNGDRSPEGIGETKNTIESIERMSITEKGREQIFSGNAKRIFKL